MPSYASKKIQILQRLKNSGKFEVANYKWMKDEVKKLFLKELLNDEVSRKSIDREYIYEETEASSTSFTFNDLNPFAYYFISIRACYQVTNDEVSCFNPTIALNQTGRDYDADRIKNLQSRAVGNHVIELTWEPPSRPNGVILSFTIYFQLVGANDDAKTLCLSFQQYILEGRRKRIENLTPGKYSLSVMVRSLAGVGSLSESIYVDVESSYSIYWIISTLAIILLLLILLLFVQKRRLESLRKKHPKLYATFINKPDDGYELEREDIELLNELGSGHFGLVFEGILRNREESGSFLKVAVKTVKKINLKSNFFA